MKSVCVYCGSSPGSDPAYLAAATAFGELLAKQGRRLVYGGGDVGLMGAVADGALAAGGDVFGVIPKALLDLEVGHSGLTELHVVASMHERKALMAELADGFVALPGGIGTFEELFEVLTWSQLGFHAKPTAILNVSGYFDALIAFIDNAVTSQFVKQVHRDLLLDARDPVQLLESMDAWTPPVVEKWIRPGQE
jgi:uncharacterized protein (TIGR00730 family)